MIQMSVSSWLQSVCTSAALRLIVHLPWHVQYTDTVCKCVHTGSLRSNKVLWETAEDQNNRHALPVTSPDFTHVSLSSTVSFVWVFTFFFFKVCWYCVNHKHKHQISTFQTVERGHVWLENLTKMLFLKNKKTKTVSYFSASRLQLRLQFLPFHGARRWSLPQSPHYCSAAAETHREKTESVWWVAVKLRVWRKNICNKESVFSALL